MSKQAPATTVRDEPLNRYTEEGRESKFEEAKQLSEGQADLAMKEHQQDKAQTAGDTSASEQARQQTADDETTGTSSEAVATPVVEVSPPMRPAKGVAAPVSVVETREDVPSPHDTLNDSNNSEAAEKAEAISETEKAEDEVQPETKAVGTGSPPPAAAAPIRIEDLSTTVREKLEEVLKGEDDGAMREDTRLVNFLGEVAEAQALAALNEYHSAVSETSVTIRNKPAYLMGILRKYKQGQRTPIGNGTIGGVPTLPSAAGRMGAGPGGLIPSIAARLDKLYDSNFIKKEDVDQRCLDFFRDLTEKEAEAAMDEFSHSDIASIRNKSAFLMSILRKHHEASNSSKPAGVVGGGTGVMGLMGGVGLAGIGMYGAHAYGASPMMGYGYLDHSMAGHNPFADFYGAAYGHHPALFNAYGQPMPAFIPPQMAMCPPGSVEILPATIQLRLDHLVATGFCKPGEIDDRCRKFLREVPEHVALLAIDELTTVDRGYIRKVSAYFMGVIRKYAEQYRAGMTDPTGVPHPYEAGMKRIRDYNEGYAAHKALKPMLLRPLGGEAREAQLMERLSSAPVKVQSGIRDLLSRGVAAEGDIDTRVSNALLQLTEEQGVAAIVEFGSCDMSRIRNKSAYLMGLLKRYRTGGPPPAGSAR